MTTAKTELGCSNTMNEAVLRSGEYETKVKYILQKSVIMRSSAIFRYCAGALG